MNYDDRGVICLHLGRRGLGLIVAQGVLWQSGEAVAQADPTAPISALRTSLQALSAVGWPPSAQVLEPLVTATFDIPGITLAVLGSANSNVTPEQNARLARALGARMVRELIRNRPSASTDQFSVIEVRSIGHEDWLIITRSDGSTGPVMLTWRVRSVSSGLRITDVLRDGVSAVQVQRQDFASALRTRTLEELVTMMESRAAR